MAKNTSEDSRLTIPYFDGVNSLVSSNIAKKQELFHAENVRSVKIGTVEKRDGRGPMIGNNISADTQYGLFYFPHEGSPNHSGLFRAAYVSGFDAPGQMCIYYYHLVAGWGAMTGAFHIGDGQIDYSASENNMFVVNYNSDNRYIKGTDGVSVVTSTDASGHLYNSPRAHRINFYKNKLYLADIQFNGIRYKTTIMMSSIPVGIISLINGDPNDIPASPVYGDPYTFDVTDTKYIYTTPGSDINYAGNYIEIRRGGALVATARVIDKTESKITVNNLVFSGSFTELLSADEIWVGGTYSGKKVFRWANNPSTGIDVKRYDTFKLSGGDDLEIKMLTNVGDYLVISNRNNLAIWDEYTLRNYDVNIGCVSYNGYIKSHGLLYFIHYTGVYTTNGGPPQLISSKVQRYFDGATRENIENSAAGKKGYSLFFTLGDVNLYETDGSFEKTLKDVVLEYNLIQQNWFVHTHIPAQEMTTWVDTLDPDRLIACIGETDLPIKELFVSGQHTDDGVEIPFRMDLNPISLNSNYENLSYPKDIIIESERGSNIKCFLSLDDGDYYEIYGEAKKGVTTLRVNNIDGYMEDPPSCRWLNVSLRDSSVQKCKISRMQVVFMPTTEDIDPDNPPSVSI